MSLKESISNLTAPKNCAVGVWVESQKPELIAELQDAIMAGTQIYLIYRALRAIATVDFSDKTFVRHYKMECACFKKH